MLRRSDAIVDDSHSSRGWILIFANERLIARTHIYYLYRRATMRVLITTLGFCRGINRLVEYRSLHTAPRRFSGGSHNIVYFLEVAAAGQLPKISTFQLPLRTWFTIWNYMLYRVSHVEALICRTKMIGWQADTEAYAVFKTFIYELQEIAPESDCRRHSHLREGRLQLSAYYPLMLLSPVIAAILAAILCVLK